MSKSKSRLGVSKSKSRLSAVRSEASRKGNANRSSWHEYAILFAADALAYIYVDLGKNRDSFEDGKPTYETFKERKWLDFETAKWVRKFVEEEAKDRKFPKEWGLDGEAKDQGGSTIARPEKITQKAVTKLFYRRRPLLNLSISERVAARVAAQSKPEMDDGDLDPELKTIAAKFERFLQS
jgi:hypothetical protein